MRRNDDFVLREIAGEYIMIPTGIGAAQFSGMIEMSETSAFVWECLEQECTEEELLQKVTNEYDVSVDVAKSDLDKLLDQMKEKQMLRM